MSHRRTPALILAGALLAFAIACSKDGTGPVLRPRAGLLVQPTWANPLSAGAPVTRAKVTARYLDGTFAAETIATYPTGADSLAFNMIVPMTTGAASGQQDFIITFRLLNALGDTLFSGGPITATAVRAGTPSAGAVTVPLVYSGPGRTAKILTAIVQDTAVAFGDSIVLTALATDTAGAPLPGTLVSWTSLDTNKVRVKDKFGGKLGGKTTRGVTQVIAATLTGQADTVNVTSQPVAAIVSLVSGSGQTGPAGTVLPLPLRVRVKAADSLGVRSIPVTFAVTSGGGSVSSATVFTDTLGFAQVTQTLGASAGAVTVTATVAAVVGSPVTFTQSTVVGTPTKLAFIVSPPASVVAGAAIAPALQVQIQDAAGNPVPSATNTVVIAIGTNPGGGTLSGTLSVAAVGGVATFSGLSINRSGAGYTLLAASTGLTGAGSTAFTIAVGAPVGLAFITGPTSANSLTAISPAIVVAVVDGSGNTVTSATTPIVMSILGGTGTAGAVLGGTITVSAVGGLATFSTLTIDRVGTGYRLSASAAAFPSALSVPFNIGPGAPALLGFQTAPPASATSLIGFPTVVEIRDAANNIVTSATGTVLLGLSAAPGGGVISGTVSAAAVAGVATFSGVVLDKAGSYTIAATSVGLTPVFSGGITLNPGAAVALQLLPAPSATAAAGAVLATQPVVTVLDAAGNTVTSASGTVTASYTGSGSVTAGPTATISAGVATFSGLTVGGLVSAANLSFTDGTRTITSPFTITVGAASLVVADSGNTQVAAIFTLLTSSIVAKVTDAFGNPISGLTVTWGVVLGGGITGAPSGVTDAAGRVRTTWTTGGVFGPNGVTATAAGVGAPANFASYGVPVGTTRTWIGVTSTAWTTASNWNPATVPISTDNVFIPSATTFAPALAAPASVTDLTVMPAVPLSLGSNTLTVAGNLDGGTAVTATTGGFTMTGSTKNIVGQNLPNLTITNLTIVVGRTTTLGNVAVTSGNFNVAGRTFVVGGVFSTSATGALVMTSSTDSLIVSGNATFGGASTSGFLTSGVLRLGGNLSQVTTANAYAPSGTHMTAFTGSAAQSATFAAPASSGFRDLTVNNPAGVTLATAGTIISGSVIATAGAITGPSATIGIDFTDAGGASPNWQVTSLTLAGNGVRLIPARVSSTNVSITGGSTYTPAGRVRFTGAGGVNVSGGSFEVTTFSDTIDGPLQMTVTGLLRMITAGGDLNVLGNVTFNGGNTSGILSAGTLRVGGNFAQGVGGTGGVNSFIATGSQKTVLQGSTLQTVTFASPAASTFRDLTVNNPAGVALVTAAIQITGSVVATAGAITGASATIGADFTDAAAAGGTPNWQVTSLTLTGGGALLIPVRVGSTNVTMTGGGYAPAGNVRFTGAGGVTVSAGSFEVTTFTDTIDGPFTTTAGGILRMATPGGDLLVGGAAAFGGGNTSGQLTQGILRIGGNFTQTSGGSGGASAFVPTGNHVTVLQGSTPQTATLAAPGTSGFRGLTVNNPAGVTLATAGTIISGSLIATSGAITGPSATIGIDFTDAGAPATPNWQVTSLTLAGNSVRLIPVRVSSPNVIISSGATYTPAGKVRFTGAGGVTVSAGAFEVASFADTIDGTFATTGSGQLRMVTAGGDLNVFGSVTFNGGNTSGQLTQGILRIGGSFTQNSGGTGGASSFVPTTNHVTVLQGSTAQTVNFTTPGTSAFRDLTVNNPAGVTLATAGTVISGSMIATAGAITGPAATIGIDFTDAGAPSAPNWQVTSLTLAGNGVRLIPVRVGSTNVTVSSGATYTMAGNVRFTGAGGVTLTAGSFEVTTFKDTIDGPFVSSAGGTLRMVTAGGELNVLGSATFGGGNTSGQLTQGILRVGGNFTQTSGGSGGTSSFVPTTNHVTVLQGSTLQTVTLAAPGTSQFRDLTVNNPAGVSLATAGTVVSGSMIATTGAITGPAATIGIDFTDAGGATPNWQVTSLTLAGNGVRLIPVRVGSTNVTVSSATTYTPAGTVRFTGAGGVTVSAGSFEVTTFKDTINGLLATTGGGLLRMVTAGGELTVLGNAAFGGGSTSGTLTQGTLRIAGNFTQTSGGSGSTSSFVPSTSHVTELQGAGAQTITFASPTTSHFQALAVTNTGGAVSFVGNASVFGATTVTGAGPNISSGVSDTVFLGSSLSDTPGRWRPTFTALTGAGSPATPATMFNTVIVQANARSLPSDLVVNGALDVSTVQLTVNGRKLTVTGQFRTMAGGTLAMTTAADSLDAGSVVFGGGTTAGLLTNGKLVVRGNFTQTAGTSPTSFAATINHQTILLPTAPATMNIATGDSLNSRFKAVVYAGTGTGKITLVGTMWSDSSLNGSTGLGGGIVGTSGFVYVRKLLNMSGVSAALGEPAARLKVVGFGATTGTFGSGGGTADTAVFFNTPLAAPPSLGTFSVIHVRFGNTVGGVAHTFGVGALSSNAGDFVIEGTNATWQPGRPVQIAGKLKTQAGGRLTMTTSVDSVVVAGAATFSGGASTLSAGSLGVVGAFTQTNASGVGNSFQASGTHRFFRNALSGAPISFTNPGTTATTSRFNRFYANGLGIDTLASSVVVMDTLFVLSSAFSHGIEGISGAVLTVGTYRDTTDLGVLKAGASGTGFTMRVRNKFDDRKAAAIANFIVDTVVADTTMGTVVTHQRLPFNVNIKNLVVEGFAKWPGSGAPTATFTGSLIARNNGSFMLDSNTVTVNGNLVTASGGVLRMPSTPAGAFAGLTVNGNATFGGGSTAGLLVKGQISVIGNFTQTGGAADAYQPSSGHVTSLNSSSRNISFANPDSNTTTPTGSRFGTLVLNACSGIQTLLTDVAVRDSVFSSPCTGATITSANKNLIVHGVNFANFQLQTTQFVWNRVSPSTTTLSTISFSGAFGTNSAFTLNNGALGGSLTYGATSLSFTTSTFSTGHLAVASAATSAFTLNLTGVTPTGVVAGKSLASGTATITWP